jgi:hypothetical protein
MPQKPRLFSLAAALAGLTLQPTFSGPTEAAQVPTARKTTSSAQADTTRLSFESVSANRFVEVGEDVLAFLVTEMEDGTVLAQHRSHYSHRSHSSHRSHYSSR